MTIDLSPLYRTAIGFDRLGTFLENAQRVDSTGYPPYNIEQLEGDSYRITMALAGFMEDDLSIESKQNELTVIGKKKEDGNQQPTFIHRGIANRNFERKFQLADHVFVDSANLESGLLHINLHRKVPEELKVRKILINSGKVIDTDS